MQDAAHRALAKHGILCAGEERPIGPVCFASRKKKIVSCILTNSMLHQDVCRKERWQLFVVTKEGGIVHRPGMPSRQRHSHSPNSLWSLNDAGVKLAFRSIERPCPVQPLAGCAAGGSLGHCSVVSHGAAAVKQQLDVSLLAVTVQQKSAPQPYVRHRPALIARHLY